MIKLLRPIQALAVLLFLTACSAPVTLIRLEDRAAAVPMLQPEDKLGEMVLTTGARGAYPLGYFCSTPVEQAGVVSVDCNVPRVSRLAIGSPLDAAGQALQGTEWSAARWEFSIDGQPVDLPAFGTYDLVYPGMAPHPSRIREVFRRMQVWDVVLENLTPGLHIVRGAVHLDGKTYRWAANISVQAGDD